MGFFSVKGQPGPRTTCPMSQCPLGLCTSNFVFRLHCLVEAPLCKYPDVDSFTEEPSPSFLSISGSSLTFWNINGDMEHFCKEPTGLEPAAGLQILGVCRSVFPSVMELPVWLKTLPHSGSSDKPEYS